MATELEGAGLVRVELLDPARPAAPRRSAGRARTETARRPAGLASKWRTAVMSGPVSSEVKSSSRSSRIGMAHPMFSARRLSTLPAPSTPFPGWYPPSRGTIVHDVPGAGPEDAARAMSPKANPAILLAAGLRRPRSAPRRRFILRSPSSSTADDPSRTNRRTGPRRIAAGTPARSGRQCNAGVGRVGNSRLRVGHALLPQGPRPGCGPPTAATARTASPSVHPGQRDHCEALTISLYSPRMQCRPRRLVIGCTLLASLAAATAPPAPGEERPALRVVARTGDVAPGGGAFDRFGQDNLPVIAPVNARGEVAFFARLSRGTSDEGIFLRRGGRIMTVAREGDRVPGVGRLSGLRQAPDAGPQRRRERSRSRRPSRAGARSRASSPGRPAACARWPSTGTPAPGMPRACSPGVDAPAVNDRGDVAFLATRPPRPRIDRGDSLERGRRAAQGRGPGRSRARGRRLRRASARPRSTRAAAVAFAAVVEGKAVPGGIFVAQRRPRPDAGRRRRGHADRRHLRQVLRAHGLNDGGRHRLPRHAEVRAGRGGDLRGRGRPRARGVAARRSARRAAGPSPTSASGRRVGSGRRHRASPRRSMAGPAPVAHPAGRRAPARSGRRGRRIRCPAASASRRSPSTRSSAWDPGPRDLRGGADRHRRGAAKASSSPSPPRSLKATLSSCRTADTRRRRSPR